MPQRPSIIVLLSGLALALNACSAEHPAPSSASAATATASPLHVEDSQHGKLQVSRITQGLVHPWALAFLPDGSMLVTERPGRLRRISADGALSAPIDGVPAVVAEGQGGLLDVALSPTFASDQRIYLSYAEPGEGTLVGTAVARARLDGDRLADLEVLFRQQPKRPTRHHFGSRLAFDRDGHLFITLGDRGERPSAQDLSGHPGSVVRLHADGRVPADNPFVGRDDARPEIWSYGHRNIQGAALHPATGALWTHEHGPRGGDEINLPQPGRNYGWPIVTHGIDYSGVPISEAVGRERAGMEPPHYVWERSPAVSGMAFYRHPRFGAWHDSLFIGSLVQRLLIRLTLDGDRVVAEERLLQDLNQRIRDVRVGPDGALYLLTDDADGQLLRVDLVER